MITTLLLVPVLELLLPVPSGLSIMPLVFIRSLDQDKRMPGSGAQKGQAFLIHSLCCCTGRQVAMANVSVSELAILKVEIIHTSLRNLLSRVLYDEKRRESLSKPNIAGEQAVSCRCVSSIAAQQPFREMII
jgi:hypothetical protein